MRPGPVARPGPVMHATTVTATCPQGRNATFPRLPAAWAAAAALRSQSCPTVCTARPGPPLKPATACPSEHGHGAQQVHKCPLGAPGRQLGADTRGAQLGPGALSGGGQLRGKRRGALMCAARQANDPGGQGAARPRRADSGRGWEGSGASTVCGGRAGEQGHGSRPGHRAHSVRHLLATPSSWRPGAPGRAGWRKGEGVHGLGQEGSSRGLSGPGLGPSWAPPPPGVHREAGWAAPATLHLRRGSLPEPTLWGIPQGYVRLRFANLSIGISKCNSHYECAERVGAGNGFCWAGF